MNNDIIEITNTVKGYIVDYGVNWIITMVITFISVRLATKKYYNTVRSRNVRPHMEQGLKLILGKDIIPANAKSILVENKGFVIFRWKKYKATHPFSLLRKTICTVGGMENTTSTARARYWGVLGLAYLKKRVVVYDFREHTLLLYHVDIVKHEVKDRINKSNIKEYYFKGDIDGRRRECFLSEEQTGRNIMIAIPLIIRGNHNDKIVGGLTFDVDCEIDEQSVANNKKKYLISNNENDIIELCKELNDIGSNIVNAYFCEYK